MPNIGQVIGIIISSFCRVNSYPRLAALCLALLNNISNEIANGKSTNIGDFIFKFMRQFMNNRIGTYIREQEVPNIRKEGIIDYNKGVLVVFEESLFCWGVDLLTNSIKTIKPIITRAAIPK